MIQNESYQPGEIVLQNQLSLLPKSNQIKDLPRVNEHTIHIFIIEKYDSGESMSGIYAFVKETLSYGTRKAKKFANEIVFDYLNRYKDM